MTQRLPQHVADHLAMHRDALAAIASGDDQTDQAVLAADAAVRAAWAHAEANERPSAWSTFADTYAGIIAARLAKTRAEAGWTQAQLAEAMVPYNTWTRFTVAEIETGRRAVSLEELVVLAGLFAEPLVTFLIPTERTRLDLPHTQLAPGVLTELLVGRGGVIGTGGRSWAAAARVASEPGTRPAPDLWAARTTTAKSRTPASHSKTRARPKKDKT